MKGSAPLSWRPQTEKGEMERELDAELKTWQSLHQSEEKVGHMVGTKVVAQYIENTSGLQAPR